MRCGKAKGFARAMVETLHHLFDSLLRNGGEVAALGKILAHQAVGVLVEAPLPGGIRMGKIEVRPQLGGKVLMARKLPPIIRSDSMHVLRQWL